MTLKINSKYFFLSLIIIISFLLTSCDIKYRRFSQSLFDRFDTIIEITSFETSEEEFSKMFEIAKNRFTELHQSFDIYNNYEGINNIKTINDNAGIKPVAVNEDILELLKEANYWYENGQGKINITLGPVLKIWKEYQDASVSDDTQNKIPTLSELKKANEYTNINDLIIDYNNKTVFLKDKNMSLDIGAIGKGFATQKVADKLQEEGYKYFSISAGGNILTTSKPSSEEYLSWAVGIQSPENSSELIEKVFVENKSVVTSGDYQRYFISNGKKYHHIIDTKTLMPATNYKSITVITDNSSDADALSTILFLLEYDEAVKFIENLNNNTEAIFVLKNGEIKYSNGINKYLER